jgi:HD superfamily phosphohydrolase YqeK
MRQASATHRINQDVQLEEKKSECWHGQAGAYPARSQLGVVSAD